MISIQNKIDCCGCNACLSVCLKQCIEMKEDAEGFLYPIVDESICIDCGLCEKVCPVINQNKERKPLHVYAAKNEDEEIRLKSSSGGIFSLLAEKIIKEGGVVFGAKFNKNWEVIHSYTETIGGLADFRGSKYVQSRIGNAYKEAKCFLNSERIVLFTGTPCQIAGLKLFLGTEYDNLLTVDFVCHGVPSPKVWQIYLESIISCKDNIKKKSVLSSLNKVPVITGISFRDKQKGWKKYGFVVNQSAFKADENTILLSETVDVNLYMKGFLNDLYLRPSCHACPAKSFKSGSDITIGDYWGIQDVLPDLDDDKGVSLVMVNTFKGKKYCSTVSTVSRETSYEDALKYNPSIEKSVAIPPKRKLFFENFTKLSFTKLIVSLTKLSILKKIKGFVSNILRNCGKL